MSETPLSIVEQAEPSVASTSKSADSRNYGWRVVFAGVGINLALGFLYAWSVISKKIPYEWNWTEAERALPYSITCLGISLPMVFAGRLQDKIGPRAVASIGGLLAGGGILLASMTHSLAGYVIGFGVLFGVGTSCAYSAVTPAAVKWFPSKRTGTITGIVVGGYGLAALYAAPLAEVLINAKGIPATMFILGLTFLVTIIGLAQLLVLPGAPSIQSTADTEAECDSRSRDHSPGEVLRTWQFYIIWFTYACGSGAGLMIISKLAKIADLQAGLKPGFILVACLGLGNGGGRILTGMLSDKIGRKSTLFMCFVVQAVLISVLSQIKSGGALGTLPVLIILSTLIGTNYGANLALYPSLTKDYYGLKNFGANFGLVHSAWGVGGFILSLLAGYVFDKTNTFSFAYGCSVILLILAAVLILFIGTPHRRPDLKA